MSKIFLKVSHVFKIREKVIFKFYFITDLRFWLYSYDRNFCHPVDCAYEF